MLIALAGAPADAAGAEGRDAGQRAGQHAGQHTVGKGQTLYAIARRYRTTVDAIRELNGMKPGQRLKPGVVLEIPDRDAPEGGAKSAAAKADPRSALDKQPSVRKEPPGREPAKTGARDTIARVTTKGTVSRARSVRPGNEADVSKAQAKRFAQKPKRSGWVRLTRGPEQLEVQLLSRQGRLEPKALPKLSRLLRASSTASLPIDPRLATLIGMVSDHFGGRTIRVVSGYRPYSPAQYTPHSNHNHGRAIDFLVEGVPNTVVRDFCRSFRNAGVGYYPNSTFVHLDVRAAKTYWVDYSKPGEPPRYDGTKGTLAADEAARDVPGAAEEEVYGSGDTQPPAAQPVDKTRGNRNGGDGGAGAGDTPGSNSPADPMSSPQPKP